MGGKKAPVEKEGRPHFNPHTMQHRELLKPGPKAAKLRMKASPYQELACGSSKRKANSSAVGSSSDTTQEGVQASTKLGEVKPIKALKVIHHRFSNGEPGDEQFKGCHCRAISEEAGTIKEGLQNGGKNGSVRATPNHLMYKDTRSGRWRTTDRQPRQYNYHLGSDGGKQLSGRVLRPRTNPKYCPDEQAPDSTSDDETVTYVKNEDKHGSDKGLGSGHLCTGLACAYPGCYARPDFRSITPTSLSHDNQKKDFEANSFCGRSSSSGCHYLSNSEPAKNQHGSISPRAAIDLATKALQSHPNPPLSMREMAANLHPEVHYCSKDLKIEDDQAANVLGKAIPCVGQDESITNHFSTYSVRFSKSVTNRQRSGMGITCNSGSTRSPGARTRARLEQPFISQFHQHNRHLLVRIQRPSSRRHLLNPNQRPTQTLHPNIQHLRRPHHRRPNPASLPKPRPKLPRLPPTRHAL